MVFIRTHIVDMGNADCILLELPAPSNERRIGIVDCGKFEPARDYLEKLDLVPTHVPFVVATHPHKDHIQGMVQLLAYLKKKGVIPESYWDCGYNLDKPMNRKLKEYLKENLSDRVLFIHEESPEFEYGPVVVKALAPQKRPTYHDHLTNNMSIVLSVKLGRAKILLGGDAQTESWDKISSNDHLHDYLSSSFMKISHHGSIRGTNPEKIGSYVRPKVVAITGNKCALSRCQTPQCFPNPNIAGAIKESRAEGVKTLNTHNHSDIVIISHKNGAIEMMHNKKECDIQSSKNAKICPLNGPIERTCAVSIKSFDRCPLNL